MKSTLHFALAVLVLLTLAQTGSVWAFESKGHRIVAQIAQNHLTPGAQARIESITEGHYLAELSTWPDKIRSDPNWQKAKAWHYIAIDDDELFETLQRNPDGDVLAQLESREKELRDAKIIGQEKWRALAFYVHFFGDIHQPLHARRRDDKGGGTITVEWFGKKTNLHMIWDTALIEHENLSFREYADFLDRVPQALIKKWQAAPYRQYVMESKAMRAKAYDFGDQKSSLPRLGFRYHFRNIDDLNQRLVQAGIRLAGKLNKIFAP